MERARDRERTEGDERKGGKGRRGMEWNLRGGGSLRHWQ